MPLNEQRAVANVRERKRTQKLNQAYKQLQSIIPKEPSDKMSKIHTLRLALTYIDFLNNILKDSDGSTVEPCTSSASVSSSGNSSQYVKSPSASSPSSYARTYATSEEEEEEGGYHHRSKRTKLANSLEEVQYGLGHHQVALPCYTTTFSEQVPEQARQLNCNNCHDCVTRHQREVVSPVDSSTSYDTDHHHSIQVPDDMKSYLRNAFREYRTGKRKSHTLDQ